MAIVGEGLKIEALVIKIETLLKNPIVLCSTHND